jgi:hypothetical protein
MRPCESRFWASVDCRDFLELVPDDLEFVLVVFVLLLPDT